MSRATLRLISARTVKVRVVGPELWLVRPRMSSDRRIALALAERMGISAPKFPRVEKGCGRRRQTAYWYRGRQVERDALPVGRKRLRHGDHPAPEIPATCRQVRMRPDKPVAGRHGHTVDRSCTVDCSPVPKRFGKAWHIMRGPNALAYRARLARRGWVLPIWHGADALMPTRIGSSSRPVSMVFGRPASEFTCPPSAADLLDGPPEDIEPPR